jgi:hypothetical protein
MQLSDRKMSLLAVLITLALLAGAGWTLVGMHRDTPRGSAAHDSASTTKKPPADRSAGNPSKNSASTPAKNTSGTIPNAGTPENPVPVTAACKLLTQDRARQLLGASAASSSPGDTSALQTPDTTISACAYAAGNDTAQLIIRVPKNSLGSSENATVFGSEKPAGATDVSGFGQVAYWDPDAHRLNVLGSNNWYLVTRGSGSLDDTKAVATLLAGGF